MDEDRVQSALESLKQIQKLLDGMGHLIDRIPRASQAERLQLRRDLQAKQDLAVGRADNLRILLVQMQS